MLLVHNRYFKGKYQTDKVLRTVIKVSEDPVKDGLEEFEISLKHLYVESIDGSYVKGAQKCVLIATARHQDNWQSLLEEWADENRFLDFQSNKFDAVTAGEFLNKCRKTMNRYDDLRLGQTIINELGDNTPTPNPDIFHSTDEQKVLMWFYDRHVEG